MKLAKEIAQDLKQKGSSIGKPALITLTIDELTLESTIAAKLEPVRKLLESIKSDVVCEGVPPVKLEWDEHDKECSPKMALSVIGAKAVEALAMLSEEKS